MRGNEAGKLVKRKLVEVSWVSVLSVLSMVVSRMVLDAAVVHVPSDRLGLRFMTVLGSYKRLEGSYGVLSRGEWRILLR